MARIPLLTGPNYRTWRKQIEILLRSRDLWDAVSPPPPSTEEEEEKEEEASDEPPPPQSP
jgi:hypothetical protein